MRLLVQIPTKNESENIGSVIDSIPRTMPGIDEVRIVVIDDNSTDETVPLALSHGADYVILKRSYHGLASSFSLGSAFFLTTKFDILVNTDGDDQYFQEKVPDLIQPILEHKADMVVGDRLVTSLSHFSFAKRVLQVLGSWVISTVAGVKVSDAASGFRAYSRAMVARLNVTTKFSYAMETLIQAGRNNGRIVSVPCGAKSVERSSRLFRSHGEHVWKSAQAILRSLVAYRPLLTFLTISALTALLGLIPFVRYVWLVLAGVAGDHLQSLILGTVLFIASFTSASLAILADSIRSQRVLIERQQALSASQLAEEQLDDLLSLYSAELINNRTT